MRRKQCLPAERTLKTGGPEDQSRCLAPFSYQKKKGGGGGKNQISSLTYPEALYKVQRPGLIFKLAEGPGRGPPKCFLQSERWFLQSGHGGGEGGPKSWIAFVFEVVSFCSKNSSE